MGFAAPSLKGRALRLLAQREHSRAELQAKLARHVQEGDDLAAVLDELEARDFINAARVADSVVNRRAARLGTQRVVQELRSKGLDEALVRATAERLKNSEFDPRPRSLAPPLRQPAAQPAGARAPDALPPRARLRRRHGAPRAGQRGAGRPGRGRTGRFRRRRRVTPVPAPSMPPRHSSQTARPSRHIARQRA